MSNYAPMQDLPLPPEVVVGIRVRPVSEGDADELVRMGREFVKQTPVGRIVGLDPETIVSFCLFGGPDLGVFIAEDNGKCVGAACVIAFPAYFNHHALLSQELFWWVDESHRGGPAGAMLYKAMEAWADAKGAKCFCMIALANEDHPRVERLYRRKGFIPAETTYVKEFPWQQ